MDEVIGKMNLLDPEGDIEVPHFPKPEHDAYFL